MTDSRKDPAGKGACLTGKRVYYAERQANRAIERARQRGELPQLRHYQCPECGWWHLSRKARAPGSPADPERSS